VIGLMQKFNQYEAEIRGIRDSLYKHYLSLEKLDTKLSKMGGDSSLNLARWKLTLSNIIARLDYMIESLEAGSYRVFEAEACNLSKRVSMLFIHGSGDSLFHSFRVELAFLNNLLNEICDKK